MRRCGFKVSWPHKETSAGSETARGNSVAPSVATHSGVGAGSAVNRAPEEVTHMNTVLFAEDHAALQDLQFLHASGLKVVWPRGHAPGSFGR